MNGSPVVPPFYPLRIFMPRLSPLDPNMTIYYAGFVEEETLFVFLPSLPSLEREREPLLLSVYDLGHTPINPPLDEESVKR